MKNTNPDKLSDYEMAYCEKCCHWFWKKPPSVHVLIEKITPLLKRIPWAWKPEPLPCIWCGHFETKILTGTYNRARY